MKFVEFQINNTMINSTTDFVQKFNVKFKDSNANLKSNSNTNVNL